MKIFQTGCWSLWALSHQYLRNKGLQLNLSETMQELGAPLEVEDYVVKE